MTFYFKELGNMTESILKFQIISIIYNRGSQTGFRGKIKIIKKHTSSNEKMKKCKC